jgi:hypothetical protein
MPMRALIAIALAALTPMAASAQQTDDAHDNLFADHSASGSNGAHRIGARLGGAPAARALPPAGPLVQPANSGIQVYHPRSLNDVAKDYKKSHPRDAAPAPH